MSAPTKRSSVPDTVPDARDEPKRWNCDGDVGDISVSYDQSDPVQKRTSTAPHPGTGWSVFGAPMYRRL